MKDFSGLDSGDLLTLGRRALELGARRLEAIAAATDPVDRPLRELLHQMALESELRAAEVERQENIRPEESRWACSSEQSHRLICSYLKSLTKSFGEGPLLRDAALFFAESLEEETSRLCRVLAEHAREWPINRLFFDLADREGKNVRYLREVVLVG